MLSLRRLPKLPAASLTRANATVTPAPPTPPPPPPPSPTKTATTAAAAPTDTPTREKAKIRGRRYPKHRPSITLERPREWRRPLAPGVLPVYDEALRLLQWDAQTVQKEANALREGLEKGTVDSTKVEAERHRLDILDIMGKVNLPDVRWKAANGLADMNQKVYRHLIEQRWREEGALDLLMERLHQMHVIPDAVSSFHPSVDLRVNFPEPPPADVYRRTRIKRRYQPVEPGVLLLNEQTRKPPHLYTTVFHTDTRLYTLMMVDLDVPDEANESFTTYLHWLQPNIPLSATTPFPLPMPNAHVPYVPPHPARGTPYHRYVLLLLPHATPAARVDPGQVERRGFNVREFVDVHGLGLGKGIGEPGGGGAHMWRSIWDEESSRIWREVLKQPEPRFGVAPRHDPYAEFKGRPKYI